MKTAPKQTIIFGAPGVHFVRHLADVLAMQELSMKVAQVSLSRRRSGARRSAGPAGGRRSDCRLLVASPLVNAGKLEAYVIIEQETVRRFTEPADHGRTRFQETVLRFTGACCSRPPARHVRSSTSWTVRSAPRSPMPARPDLCRRRHQSAAARGEPPEAAGHLLLEHEIKLWGDVILHADRIAAYRGLYDIHKMRVTVSAYTKVTAGIAELRLLAAAAGPMAVALMTDEMRLGI